MSSAAKKQQSDPVACEQAVRAIGRCAVTLERAAERCINVLLDLIKQKVNYVVQEAVVVITDIFRRYPNRCALVLQPPTMLRVRGGPRSRRQLCLLPCQMHMSVLCLTRLVRQSLKKGRGCVARPWTVSVHAVQWRRQ